MLVGTLTPYHNGFSKVKGNQFEAKSYQMLFWLEEHYFFKTCGEIWRITSWSKEGSNNWRFSCTKDNN